jgi:triacylglycerol lipase
MSNNHPISTDAPAVPDSPSLELRIGEILASRKRMWLRGRVVQEMSSNSEPGWFARRWWRARQRRGPQTGQLEVRIGRHLLRSEVSLSPDGYFEFSQDINLPPSRRGWRVARNRLTLGEDLAEGCGVFLTPGADVKEAVLVTLPLEWTFADGGAEKMAASDLALRLGVFLQRLRRQVETPRTLYYLASAPLAAETRQQELSLAITALNWPHGTVVVLPCAAANKLAPLVHGVERLRWLFADSLDVSVINLEPELVEPLHSQQEVEEDHASLTRVIQFEDEFTELGQEFGMDSSASLTPALRPSRSHRVTRYPVVFCHGMLVVSALRMNLPENLNCFIALEPFLKERGFHTLFPQVPPTSGVAARAKQLREQILRWTDGPVNLIAHSMGGLDARYMISHLDMADRVRSLTTIATPHHGSYMANWFLQNYHQRVPLLRAMEAVGVSIDGFRNCRPDACSEFNAATPDMPDVHYYSYGGAVPHWRVSPILRRFWTILTPVEGANDGMVSVASAHWGEYLGTIPADHFAQTPDSVLAHPAETFDALDFYVRLVDDLAWRGF